MLAPSEGGDFIHQLRVRLRADAHSEDSDPVGRGPLSLFQHVLTSLRIDSLLSLPVAVRHSPLRVTLALPSVRTIMIFQAVSRAGRVVSVSIPYSIPPPMFVQPSKWPACMVDNPLGPVDTR